MLLLICVHQTFFAYPVHHSRYPGGFLGNYIYRFGREYLRRAAGIFEVGLNIPFHLGTVKMPYHTVYVNTLSYRGISLQTQLVLPKLCLPHKDQSHGTHGIKLVIQQKSEFLKRFFFQQMRFVKYADDLLFLNAPDDLYLAL